MNKGKFTNTGELKDMLDEALLEVACFNKCEKASKTAKIELLEYLLKKGKEGYNLEQHIEGLLWGMHNQSTD